jgi:integrase-like protein
MLSSDCSQIGTGSSNTPRSATESRLCGFSAQSGEIAPRSSTHSRRAQIVIEHWRVHYDTIGPHSSLGYRPPSGIGFTAIVDFSLLLHAVRGRGDSATIRLSGAQTARSKAALLHHSPKSITRPRGRQAARRRHRNQLSRIRLRKTLLPAAGSGKAGIISRRQHDHHCAAHPTDWPHLIGPTNTLLPSLFFSAEILRNLDTVADVDCP